MKLRADLCARGGDMFQGQRQQLSTVNPVPGLPIDTSDLVENFSLYLEEMGWHLLGETQEPANRSVRQKHISVQSHDPFPADTYCLFIAGTERHLEKNLVHHCNFIFN